MAPSSSSGSSLDFCRACRFQRCARYAEKNGFTLFQCLRCRSVTVPAPESEAIVQGIYDSHYGQGSADVPPATEASLSALVERLAPYRQSGRWLDVGYGGGALLRAAGRRGWECYGSETSRSALEVGDREGWVVTSRLEDDERFPDGSFDVVSMIEFIEHVHDPDLAFRMALRKLRPGGALYITTPNAHSLNARLLKERWSAYAPPEHLTIWSRRGIRLALRRVGFTVVRVQTHGLNPFDLRSALSSRPNTTRPAGRNEAGVSLNETFSASPARRRLKSVLNDALSFLGVGDTVKVQAECPRGAGSLVGSAG